jgi:hypothetical protein
MRRRRKRRRRRKGTRWRRDISLSVWHPTEFSSKSKKYILTLQ